MKRRPDVYVSDGIVQTGETPPYPSKSMLGIRISDYHQIMHPDEARRLARDLEEAADRAEFGNVGRSANG